MSAALIKKALEIFDSADADVAGRSSSSFKEKSHKTAKVKKKKKKKAVQGIKKNFHVDSKGAKVIRKTQEAARSNKDHTEENLKLLLSLSKNKHSKFTSRILELSGRTTQPKEIPPVSTTVFTEEDFAKFEQEYFVN